MKNLILLALMAPASLAVSVHAHETGHTHAHPAPAAGAPAARPSAPAPAGARPNSLKTGAGKGAAADKAPAAGEDPGHGMPGHQHGADEEPEEAHKPFGPDESNTEYFWRRSDKAFHDGDYEGAVALHRAIIALDPTDTESFGVAAWLLWSMGKHEESNAHLQLGLKLNPESSDMWNEAAQQYDLQKKLPEARAAYINALKFAPPGENTMMLRRRLAHAAEKAGDKKLALETWQALVKEFPNDQVNKNNLARVEKSMLSASIGVGPAHVATLIKQGKLLPPLIHLARMY